MTDWHDFLDHGAVRIAITGVLAILALFLFVETASVAENLGRPSNAATDTITVTGTGRAFLAPDIAHVSFTVQNTAAKVADAQAATTKQANAAIAQVGQMGIATADVKTLYYSVNPQYSYPHCPPGAMCPVSTSSISGYQVSESIQITVRNLDTISPLLAALGTLQVQNVSGPDFTLDDPNAGYDAARSNAIANAKAEASKLSQELGVGLGSVVNFSESQTGNPYPVAYGMAAQVSGSANSAPSVPTGQNEYSANVSITYEIRH